MRGAAVGDGDEDVSKEVRRVRAVRRGNFRRRRRLERDVDVHDAGQRKAEGIKAREAMASKRYVSKRVMRDEDEGSWGWGSE